ncbi:MAG TPA: hypothetical protein VGD79_11365 [Thermoanaerobaculia bacterium]|jgi:hypothetical protein
METIAKVPVEAVGQVVQDFVSDGASRVEVVRDDEGTFTVTRK